MCKIYSRFESRLFQELSDRNLGLQLCNLTPCKFLQTCKYLLTFKFLKRNLLENLFGLTLSIFQLRKRFLMQSSYLSVYSFCGSDSVHIKKGLQQDSLPSVFPGNSQNCSNQSFNRVIVDGRFCAYCLKDVA